MKFLTLFILTTFSLTATAHPGHGETSAFNHDIEHAFGYIAIASLVALILFVARKRQ